MRQIVSTSLGAVYRVEKIHEGVSSYDGEGNKYAFFSNSHNSFCSYALDVESNCSGIPDIFKKHLHCISEEEFYRVWTEIEVVAKLENVSSFFLFKKYLYYQSLDEVIPKTVEIIRADCLGLWVAIGIKFNCLSSRVRF